MLTVQALLLVMPKAVGPLLGRSAAKVEVAGVAVGAVAGVVTIVHLAGAAVAASAQH